MCFRVFRSRLKLSDLEIAKKKDISIKEGSLSFQETKSALQDRIWNELSNRKLGEYVGEWLSRYSKHTAINYYSGILKLEELGLVSLDVNLQTFSLINHNNILDQIKLVPNWSETTRQARAACYISLTSFLSRKFDGIIPRAQPKKGKSDPTFYKIRRKVKTQALNRKQWMRFLENLSRINHRDHLIAKMILQGGKRVGEVLSLRCEQIDWNKNRITFRQSKSQYQDQVTIISYPIEYMSDLKEYIGDRVGLVFVTKSRKEVPRVQLFKTFTKASTGLPFKVSPHVLRATNVTYLNFQGYSASDIQKVTGHSSVDMVNAYDKTPLEDNPSLEISLI